MRVISDELREKFRAGGKTRAKGFTAEYQRNAGLARARAFTTEYQRAAGLARYRMSARSGTSDLPRHLEAYKRDHPSSLEKIVCAWLDRRGYRYQREVPIANFSVDFLVADTRIVIEADSDAFHTYNPKWLKIDYGGRDAIRNMILAAQGYTVIRLSEQQLKSGSFAAILEQYL